MIAHQTIYRHMFKMNGVLDVTFSLLRSRDFENRNACKVYRTTNELIHVADLSLMSLEGAMFAAFVSSSIIPDRQLLQIRRALTLENKQRYVEREMATTERKDWGEELTLKEIRLVSYEEIINYVGDVDGKSAYRLSGC